MGRGKKGPRLKRLLLCLFWVQSFPGRPIMKKDKPSDSSSARLISVTTVFVSSFFALKHDHDNRRRSHCEEHRFHRCHVQKPPFHRCELQIARVGAKFLASLAVLYCPLEAKLWYTWEGKIAGTVAVGTVYEYW